MYCSFCKLLLIYIKEGHVFINKFQYFLSLIEDSSIQILPFHRQNSSFNVLFFVAHCFTILF